MSDFNIQQVKAKLEKDLKETLHVSKTFEKDSDSLEKRKETSNSDFTQDDSISTAEEDNVFKNMQSEFDEDLNRVVSDFAGMSPQSK